MLLWVSVRKSYPAVANAHMKITVNSSIYLYLAILILILPIKWLFAWLIALCFHEFSHYLAVKLCDGKSYHLRVSFGGAVISCSELTDIKKLIALLSGPLGGLLLVFVGPWFPRLALCSWLLSLYNLLPLLPLDGGQALRLMMKNSKIFYTVERTILIILTVCCIYASVILRFGVLPIVIIGMLWLKNRNIPCKELTCKVQ